MKTCKALVLFALVGCATTGVSIIPIDYQFADLPHEHRVELRWRNDTNETLCLAPEAWPIGGLVYQGSDSVFLVVGGQRFPMMASMLGHCYPPTACGIHVAPGEEVSASIPYRYFSLPEELADHPKTLEFHAYAMHCR